MTQGTLDILRLEGAPVTFQITFERDAGGSFVSRLEPQELVMFLHEEMRVELPLAENAARRADTEGRARVVGLVLDENDLHAVMDYLEESA